MWLPTSYHRLLRVTTKAFAVCAACAGLSVAESARASADQAPSGAPRPLPAGRAARGAAPPTGTIDGPWTGSVQCRLTVNTATYQETQTHTWRFLSGERLPFNRWPAVWTVEGAGSRQTSAGSESWTIRVPETSAPITVRAQPGTGQIEIRSEHAPLVNSGAVLVTTATGQRSAFSFQEWAFPVIQSAATSATISGTRTRTIPWPGNGWRVPSSEPSEETCAWNLTRGGEAGAASSPVTSGVVAGTTTAVTTSTTDSQTPATVQVAAQSPTTVDSTAAAGASGSPASTAEPSLMTSGGVTAGATLTLDGNTLPASGSTTVNAVVTPSGVVKGSLSGPTQLVAGAQGTFTMALTLPAVTEATVVYSPAYSQTVYEAAVTYPNTCPENTAPDPSFCPETGTKQVTVTTVIQAVSKTTTTILVETSSLTFDSSEGDIATVSWPTASAAPSPLSATFTFQAEGTYSVSVKGTITVTERAATVMTVTTTKSWLDPYCNCTKNDRVTTVQPTSTTLKSTSHQISASLPLRASVQYQR